MKTRKRFIFILSFLFLLLCSCTKTEAAFVYDGDTTKPSATVIISGMDNEVILNEKVSFSEKCTVFDATLFAAKSKNIALFYSGTKSSVYVLSINGLEERANGEGSGWIYSVNETVPDQSAGKLILRDKDVVRWTYTLDFGKDVDTNVNK